MQEGVRHAGGGWAGVLAATPVDRDRQQHLHAYIYVHTYARACIDTSHYVDVHTLYALIGLHVCKH